jgi:hypothetical protein
MTQTQAVLFILCGLLLAVIPIIGAKIMKAKLGSSGKTTDPVRVVRCDKILSGFGEPFLMPSPALMETIQVTVGAGMGRSMPGFVTISFMYIDALKKVNLGRTEMVAVENHGMVGTVKIQIPNKLYPSKLYFRAWISSSYEKTYGIPWINTRAYKEEELIKKWMLKKLKKSVFT